MSSAQEVARLGSAAPRPASLSFILMIRSSIVRSPGCGSPSTFVSMSSRARRAWRGTSRRDVAKVSLRIRELVRRLDSFLYYSHSIVPGGFDVRSRARAPTPSSAEISRRNSSSSGSESSTGRAVMARCDLTGRTTTISPRLVASSDVGRRVTTTRPHLLHDENYSFGLRVRRHR